MIYKTEEHNIPLWSLFEIWKVGLHYVREIFSTHPPFPAIILFAGNILGNIFVPRATNPTDGQEDILKEGKYNHIDNHAINNLFKAKIGGNQIRNYSNW